MGTYYVERALRQQGLDIAAGSVRMTYEPVTQNQIFTVLFDGEPVSVTIPGSSSDDDAAAALSEAVRERQSRP